MVNYRFGHSRTFSQLGFQTQSSNFLFVFFSLQKLSVKCIKSGSLVSSIYNWLRNPVFISFLVLALPPPPLSMKTVPQVFQDSPISSSWLGILINNTSSSKKSLGLDANCTVSSLSLSTHKWCHVAGAH